MFTVYNSLLTITTSTVSNKVSGNQLMELMEFIEVRDVRVVWEVKENKEVKGL